MRLIQVCGLNIDVGEFKVKKGDYKQQTGLEEGPHIASLGKPQFECDAKLQELWIVSLW